MKSKIQVVTMSLSLVLISLVSPQWVWAQHSHDHKDSAVWKTGMLRVSKPVWAADVRLKSGMYHVKHVVDGNTHVIVFKAVTLPGGKGFPMWEGKEVARMECRVETVTQSVNNTKVIFSKTDAGERSIQEIQIAGEKVRHILLPDTGASQ